jgi:hypothetical protein
MALKAAFAWDVVPRPCGIRVALEPSWADAGGAKSRNGGSDLRGAPVTSCLFPSLRQISDKHTSHAEVRQPSIRFSRRITADASQAPPRLASTSAAFSAAAISRNVVAPPALARSICGRMRSANS